MRVLIVDDHPMVRERLAEVIQLEPDLCVCGEAETSRQALAVAAVTQPDLAIIDLMLRESHGIDLIKDLQTQYPKLLMLVVSMYDESLYAERALRAGAQGYIHKQEATRNIITAIRCLLAGEVYLSESCARALAARVVGHPPRRTAPVLPELTDRELQVFELLGAGHTPRQIAALLRLDVSTIETYRNRIKEKLHLRDANEVLKAAIQMTRPEPLP